MHVRVYVWLGRGVRVCVYYVSIKLRRGVVMVMVMLVLCHKGSEC